MAKMTAEEFNQWMKKQFNDHWFPKAPPLPCAPLTLEVLERAMKMLQEMPALYEPFRPFRVGFGGELDDAWVFTPNVEDEPDPEPEPKVKTVETRPRVEYCTNIVHPTRTVLCGIGPGRITFEYCDICRAERKI
jgi:hypothetical protein